LYENGRGVSRDYTQAFDYYLQAAKRGSAVAQHNIGDLYQHGDGVPKE
jgi:TPR repeat protein